MPIPDGAPKNGVAPLHLASRNGHVAAMSFLIAHGVDLQGSANFVAEPRNQVAFNLLNLCLLQPNLSARVNALLNHSVEVNDGLVAAAVLQARLLHGETILHAAVRLGRIDVLQLVIAYLMSTGTLTNLIDAPNANGTTPLSIAFVMQNFSAADLLLDAGAMPVVEDPRSLTPVHLTTTQNQGEEPPRKKRKVARQTLLQSIFQKKRRFPSQPVDFTPLG